MRRVLDSIDAELTPAAAPWARTAKRSRPRLRRRCRARVLGGVRPLAAALRGRARPADGGKPQIGDARPRAAEERRDGEDPASAGQRAARAAGTRHVERRLGFLHLPLSRDRRLPARLQLSAAAALRLCAGHRRRRAESRLSPARALSRDRRVRAAQPDLSRGPRLPRLQGEAAARHAGRGWRAARHRQRSMSATSAAPRTSSDEPERCHACGARMGGIHPIRNVLRIDNVETQPAERITANDEERQRQGFDIQTVFAWPRRDGALDVTSARRERRRRPDPVSRLRPGRDDQPAQQGAAPAQGKEHFRLRHRSRDRPLDRQPRGRRRRRTPDRPVEAAVVPIVQDTKNAVLLRLPARAAVRSRDGHAAARPGARARGSSSSSKKARCSPSRCRRATADAPSWPIEATEGGAGVLGRADDRAAGASPRSRERRSS